ncbi:EAL domain-containing protein [Synechococcus sp. BO 8801]|uniref:putative bifunctional diguanylate cyclase/phosphodiesterase n=2 Tax=Synechococcus TaxID=1129 RepID=UPI00130327E8|nr:EAL domain-containing protein [Synechococcus sp. BO 8801]
MELRRSMGRLEAALGTISDALVITSCEGRVLWCNASYARLVDRTPPAVLGESIYDQLPRDCDSAPLLNPELVLAGGDLGGHFTRVLDRSELRAIEIEWKPIRSERLRPLIFCFRDVSALLSYEQLRVEAERIERRRQQTENLNRALELERLALATKVMECPVTGLPNRRGLHVSIRAALKTQRQSGGRISILFCDLNSFKEINDLHGHQIGDDLLIEIGRRLQHSLRFGDILSRLGGDEFVVLTMGIFNEADALQLAMRLNDAVGQAWSVEDHTIRPSMSIGITISDDPDITVDELIRRADLAMYEAKTNDQHIAFYHSSIDKKVRKNIHLRHQLEGAIQHEAMFLAYQPIVGLEDRAVVGMEALLRLGAITAPIATPSEFIPLAERTALILPIGRWVISEALRHLSQLRAEGSEITMAINVSPLQLKESGLSDYFLTQAERLGVDPGWTVIEVTESILIEHPELATSELSRLREAGVKVHLDDFGTGYSSMSWLARLPIDSIKVDRSFIADFLNDHRKAVVLEAMIRLSHDLGLGLIAEGIETAEQHEGLLAMGCDQGQGFFFGRPEPLSRSFAVPAQRIGR